LTLTAKGIAGKLDGKMEEEEARLALLQTELNSIQTSIRSLDSISFQIKGWCVTASLAIGGIAIAYHNPALLLVGGGAVLGFFMINCHVKMYQHLFFVRNNRIDSELKNTGIMHVLKGAGSLDIVGTTDVRANPAGVMSITERIRKGFPRFWREARVINTFSLYLFIGLCLMIEGIILLS